MEDLLPQFSWNRLLAMALALGILYFVVQWLAYRLKRLVLPRAVKASKYLARFLMVIYEPVAVVLLAGAFFLIHPILHGLLLVLLVIVSYKHLRNYVSGRIVQLGRDWQPGSQLEAGATKGVITRMGRLGIYLRDNEGQHYIGYASILNNGYTLFTDKSSGGFHHLEISLADTELNIQQLEDRLIKIPYLDWSYKPVLENTSSGLEARVFLKDDKQLPDMLELLSEWGYKSKVLDKK